MQWRAPRATRQCLGGSREGAARGELFQLEPERVGLTPPPCDSRRRAAAANCACYCFSGTVIGLPLSATMKARTLAGSVRLALAETACNLPGPSWKVLPIHNMV